MDISILCSSESHPVNNMLSAWIDKNRSVHVISLCRKKKDLAGGDILFLISCSEIISRKDRKKYKKVLVLHASDLPRGRGWSPHVWDLLDGATEITLSLLEAEDEVDTGDIWKKITFSVPKHALHDEINAKLFEAEGELMDYAVSNLNNISPVAQEQLVPVSYHRRRTPGDSELDPNKSISELFDLLRVCDPNRFPPFFRLHGHKYLIKIEKASDE